MKTKRLSIITAVTLGSLALGLVAWKSADSVQPVGYRIRHEITDTVPNRNYRHREYSAGEIDKAMKEVDRAMSNMNFDFNMDMSKMKKDLKASMDELAKIDFSQIDKEIKASMKDIDVDVAKTVRTALESVNMKEISEQVSNALRDVKVNVHIDGDLIAKQVELGMAAARTGIREAKEKLHNMKGLIDALEQDKLIDGKKGYKIETRHGDLYLNGVKQSKEVSDKYRKYFGDEDMTIRDRNDEDDD